MGPPLERLGLGLGADGTLMELRCTLQLQSSAEGWVLLLPSPVVSYSRVEEGHPSFHLISPSSKAQWNQSPD